MPDLNQNPQKNNLTKWRMAWIAFDLGYVIALPLLILGLLGKYLDGKYGTQPWLTLAGILIAIAATTFWLTSKIRNYLKGNE